MTWPTVLLALTLTLATPAAAVSALPIPPGPFDAAVPTFQGEPADPRPIHARAIPQHPHLAANGASNSTTTPTPPTPTPDPVPSAETSR